MLSRSTRSLQRCWNVRRLQTAADIVDGPPVTETNRKRAHLPSDATWLTTHSEGAEVTLKRFWKTVGVQDRGDDIAVTLDKMALKTPGGNTLLLPAHKKLVATLVATEWEHQDTVIKHHALPVVRSRQLSYSYIAHAARRRHQ